MARERIAIAILGLGGQGGGVLADWIVQLGDKNGYVAQGTSVPGVAQRTGSTVYYVEMMPAGGPAEPVLALMPVPGDVDIAIASELMETGRAILRGFVAKDRTTLIGSTHRIYAISEKSAMGDGRASAERILTAARERAKSFIGFDMDAAAERAGCPISAILFGALAGSGALPFPRAVFEAAIRAGGKAVDANLAGFDAGYAAAQGGNEETWAVEAAASPPTSAAGQALVARIHSELPESAYAFAIEGVRRLMDYQDEAYARLYLDRLGSIPSGDGALIAEAARHLALWMAYEDTIRVADLKIRASRFARVREEVRAAPDQIVRVTEYMHPRLEEVCETLPAGLGRRILASKRLSNWLHPFFAKGRHVETTGLRWFLMLNLLAGFRRWRRKSLRYAVEHARIEAWLELVRAAARDSALALELTKCQQLIKGYGDTFARGLANYDRIVARYRTGGVDAGALRRLREAALADEDGEALDLALAG
ncbi:indolepyruvate oxidoreductase subunit beta family protein [Sphingosinicella sp. LHD-64]|uniref:indolepyruvate oxidoreductase subunit beta family protein n=1 Tax=Sphingosinicella sp. LHD-64 TaxID=3072139 RepID=UPI00280F7C33|nr:indolepyruvate oxidoreductase subunit beta family protein [Sphingosinicella sp. LHD-64]MDQ8756502.1 indolepyruvate oxidoreductase subunit beta family protein [Sphingosinicella sp. LHD-64]